MKKIFFLVLALAFLLIPLVVESSFILHLFILIFFYIALSVAWNILALSGNVSLGHCAFFGLAAYTSAILYIKFGILPWFGLVAGVAMALLGAVAMSLPMLRLRGPMFSLATIAFGEVLRQVAITWRDLTAGSEGLTIPFETGWLYLMFSSKAPFYYLFLILAVLSIYIAHRLYYSAVGYHLRAIAADAEAAQSLGINTSRVQMIALFWSAGITGALGVFFTQYVYMIEPEWAFSMMLFSVQPVLNGIIGGIGTVFGPVLGAILMTPLGEYLRSYLGGLHQGFNFFVYGLILIGVVMVAPGGIFPSLVPLLKAKGWVRNGPQETTPSSPPGNPPSSKETSA
jgi:branched-chain amino acid transport system permease protein